MYIYIYTQTYRRTYMHAYIVHTYILYYDWDILGCVFRSWPGVKDSKLACASRVHGLVSTSLAVVKPVF